MSDLVERLGCHRIYGQLSPKNVRSARLLEKLGMHVESLAPRSYWCRGAWDDNLVYAMDDTGLGSVRVKSNIQKETELLPEKERGDKLYQFSFIVNTPQSG